MSKTFFVSLALAASLLLPAPARAADVFEYNFQSTYAGPHVLNLHDYQPWIKELEAKSNGRLKLHFFMNGALVKTEEATPSIMNGNLDIGGCGPQYTDSLFPHTLAFTVPHIAADSVQSSALFWKAYEEIPEVKAEWDKVGKVLTIWGSDRSGFFCPKDPVFSPADMRGKRVLIWSGGQVDQVKAWGGIPVQVSSNDTYMALQRGMGDMFFGPLPTGVAYKLMEVSKHITIIPANSIYIANVMNWDCWNELPEDLQNLLMEGQGKEGSIRAGALLYQYTNKDLETMKAAGCTIHTLTPEQYQAFKDADREVTMDWWNKDLKRLGVADPAMEIKRAYDMAAQIPVANPADYPLPK